MKITAKHLLTHLADGPLRSADLRRQAGNIDRMKLSRLMSSLGREIVTMGQSRAIQYGRRRDVKGMGDVFPVYRIDTEGDAHRFGLLHALHGGYWWEPAESAAGSLHRGLPWFVQEMRPEGFMGEARARQLRGLLPLPGKPEDWSEDHLLVALIYEGFSAGGDLIIGNEPVRNYLASTRLPAAYSEPSDYPRLAEEALSGGGHAQARVGGAQPKFTTMIERDGVPAHVIVKFSPPITTREGERWSDLLVCEHLALQVVSEAGIPAANTNLVTVDNRTFLQIERFDRIGRFGRAPAYSLGIIDNEYFGSRDSWTNHAKRLRTAGMMNRKECGNLAWLDAFGALIGNTDRHFGNAALVPITQEKTKFALAPAYDMLPMHYRPWPGGELSGAPVIPKKVSRITTEAMPVVEGAKLFWDHASGDQRISPAFRQICLNNLKRLEQVAS